MVISRERSFKIVRLLTLLEFSEIIILFFSFFFFLFFFTYIVKKGCTIHQARKKKGMKSVYWEPSLQESLLLRSKDIALSIVCVSSTAVATFMVLPQENVDGRPVPALFRDRSTLYYVFLISALDAFLGSLGSLLIQHKPRVERFCRVFGVAFVLSALAIVLYATALWFAIPLPSSM